MEEKEVSKMAVGYRCLHCKGNLAELQRGKHCESKRCTWLKCACGAINDIKNKRAMHKEHGVACQADNAPCQLRKRS